MVAGSGVGSQSARQHQNPSEDRWPEPQCRCHAGLNACQSSFDTKKAQKKLRAYVERSQRTIDIKSEIILDHFIPQVVNAKKLRGKAKGMVITQNIEAANSAMRGCIDDTQTFL